MKYKRFSMLMAGTLSLGFLTPPADTFAADEPTKTPVADAAHADAKLDRASKIIGRIARNARNNDIGRVMDLIIDSRDGTVAYAIMRFGDWFDETRFVVPFSALKLHENGKNFTLPIEKNQLDKSKGFKSTEYPDMSDATWAREVHRQFGVEPYWQEDSENIRRRNRDRNRQPQISKDSTWVNRVNEILGKPLVGANNADLGKVKDLVIDLEHRHVVAYVTAEGRDEKQIAWASVEPMAKESKLAVRAVTDTPTTPSVTTQPPTTPAARTNVGTSDTALQNSSLVRGESLLRDVVKDAKGAEIGRIMDVVVDTHGDAAYAIMRFGDWHGQTRFAVPFAALKQDSVSKTFTLDITKDKLDRSKGFERDSYPDMSDDQWARATHQQFGVKPYWERKSPSSKDELRNPWFNKEYTWMNRLSSMLGKSVITVSTESDGKHTTLGRMKDIVIDVNNSQVAYAVVAHADNLEKLSLVPWTAMEVNPKEQVYAVRVSKDVFAQGAFNEGSWPNLTDAQFARGVHERFNKDPYWTVFGTPSTTNDAGTTTTTRTDFGAGWRSDSAYNKLFNEDNVKTVRGTVTKVDTFTVERGNRNRGRVITIKTDDGVTHNVHLGPADFLDSGSFKISEGDDLTITGSTATFEGSTVILASRVREGNETLHLRNREGNPLWDRGSAGSNP